MNCWIEAHNANIGGPHANLSCNWHSVLRTSHVHQPHLGEPAERWITHRQNDAVGKLDAGCLWGQFQSRLSMTILSCCPVLWAADAIQIASELLPDILVMDLNMPGNAFQAITQISSKQGSTKVVAFTASPGIEHAVMALEAGASGYILKGGTIEELVAGLRAVHEGETYLPQGFATKVIVALRNDSIRKIAAQAIRLSVREDQIVRLLLKGHTNKQIAKVLSISDKTVKHYMTILMQKLNARNRLEVVIQAQKMDADGREIPTLQ